MAVTNTTKYQMIGLSQPIAGRKGNPNGHMENTANSNSLDHQCCQHMCDGLCCIHDKANSKNALFEREEKSNKLIRTLSICEEDLVRFYSAFSTSPKETMADVLVAYEILWRIP